MAATDHATLGCPVALRPDSELNIEELRGLLQRVQQQIHEQPDKVRYNMNKLLISDGGFVAALTELAMPMCTQISRASVDMGNTACRVPFAPDYVRKVQARRVIGRRRKTISC